MFSGIAKGCELFKITGSCKIYTVLEYVQWSVRIVFKFVSYFI
jgi:hypothetical protein